MSTVRRKSHVDRFRDNTEYLSLFTVTSQSLPKCCVCFEPIAIEGGGWIRCNEDSCKNHNWHNKCLLTETRHVVTHELTNMERMIQSHFTEKEIENIERQRQTDLLTRRAIQKLLKEEDETRLEMEGEEARSRALLRPRTSVVMTPPEVVDIDIHLTPMALLDSNVVTPYSHIPQMIVTTAIKEDELRRVFAIYDVDKTGYLDREEFKQEYINMEAALGVIVSDKQVERLFTKYDKSKDGKLSFDEFALLMLERAKM
eukprot:PhF_6_TR32130/c1_g1_i1/m.47564